MVFFSLSFFFSFWQKTEAQPGSAGTSAQKKKKEEKSEERKIEAQMASNILKTSMMKSSEIESQGLGSHPFDERFFKDLFLDLS